MDNIDTVEVTKDEIIADVVNTLAKLNIITLDNVKSTKDIITSAFYDYNIVRNSNCTSLVVNADEEFYDLCRYYANKKYVGLVKENSINQVLFEAKKMYRHVDKPFREITTEDIEMYFYWCRSKCGCKATTIQNKKSYLSSFYTCLVKNKKLVENPILNIEPIKVPKKLKKPLTDTEVAKLEEACKDYRDKALLAFMLGTGVRAQELCNIQIQDIDFQKSEVFVRNGKGSKDRVVPFKEKPMFLLQKYLETRTDIDITDGRCDLETPLFISKKKPYKKLKVGGVEEIINNIGNRSGVTRVHPHLLRATYATNLAKQGVPINIIAKLLGHSDLHTINRYVLMDDADIRKAISIV